MPALEDAIIYGIQIRESANDGSDFGNADADYRIAFLGEDGVWHVKDSAGAVTEPFTAGGGSGQGLVDFAFATRTAGDVTCSADQIWADVDTGIDLTLTAATGDRLEIGISGCCTGTEAVSLNLTAMSIVSAAPVNDLATGAAPSNTTNGVSGWRIQTGTAFNCTGAFICALQAGDISGGTVTIRLRYRTSSNTNRVLRADTAIPLHWYAKNLGPAM